jgi:hypothetical protein
MSEEELIQQRDDLRRQLVEKDAKLIELRAQVAKLEVVLISAVAYMF